MMIIFSLHYAAVGRDRIFCKYISLAIAMNNLWEEASQHMREGGHKIQLASAAGRVIDSKRPCTHPAVKVHTMAPPRTSFKYHPSSQQWQPMDIHCPSAISNTISRAVGLVITTGASVDHPRRMAL